MPSVQRDALTREQAQAKAIEAISARYEVTTEEIGGELETVTFKLPRLVLAFECRQPSALPARFALTTVDELDHPDDLAIGCRLGDEVLQDGRTSDLMFDVRELVSKLSYICPLLPGDIIFTGTPSGVGNAREPKRFLPPGGVLTSSIEGLGELQNHFVPGFGYPVSPSEG